MTTRWRKPYVVITRKPGHWTEGKFYPEESGIPRNVLCTIQNPSPGDKNAIEALPIGRRVSRFIKIYTDERLNAVSQEPSGFPGDLILFDHKQFIIVGETIFQNMKTRVSHFRYFAAQTIEHDDGEAVP